VRHGDQAKLRPEVSAARPADHIGAAHDLPQLEEREDRFWVRAGQGARTPQFAAPLLHQVDDSGAPTRRGSNPNAIGRGLARG